MWFTFVPYQGAQINLTGIQSYLIWFANEEQSIVKVLIHKLEGKKFDIRICCDHFVSAAGHRLHPGEYPQKTYQ